MAKNQKGKFNLFSFSKRENCDWTKAKQVDQF